MRKHRVLAGILTVIMLLGTMPTALAAEKDEDVASRNPDPIVYSNGVILGKTATSLSGTQTTVNLTVSAPTDQKPVAVEFVLDGTQSLFPDKNSTGADKANIDAVATAVCNALQGKNAYVGITVFGRSAWTALSMQAVPSAANLDLSTSVIRELLDPNQVGTNVEAGLKKGLEDLAKAPSNAAKYLVLVTDGGSYWWMNGNTPANNQYTTADGVPVYMQNNEAAEGGYTELASLSELSAAAKAGNLPRAGRTISTSSAEALSEAVKAVKADSTLYTSFETGVYYAYEQLKAIPEDVHLITVSAPYYANDGKLTALNELAGEFISEANQLSDKSYSLSGKSMSDIAKAIAGAVQTVVPAGSTIVDFMGKDTTPEVYDFDLVTTASVTLTVNSDVMTATLKKTGDYYSATFSDGSVMKYYPDSSKGEYFSLKLGKDLLRGQKLNISYTEKLSVYDKTESVTHSVHTNVQAYLNTDLTGASAADVMLFPDPVLRYSFYTGGGGGGGGTDPIKPDDGGNKPSLNTTDHYAYIIGRKDGLVHPEAQVTRAEVATIFFRMLTDESRNELWSQSNPYSDITPDMWCNAAVSTMTRAGVIQGFKDGTFRPNAPITRAEFATIAVRFFEVAYSGNDKFSDIEGHWAADYINKAAEAAIIAGFQDGTFRPNTNITRAQAMTIFNRVLGRAPEKDHLLSNMITWPDNMDTNAWYYATMQEATNSHEYEKRTAADGTIYEVWTKLLPVRDWAAFEKEWSDANSAANPGEVVSVVVVN